MNAPFVVAGGIVRNRAWILPRHLTAAAFNRPAQMFYLWGDCADETGQILHYGVEHGPRHCVMYREHTPTGDGVGLWCHVPIAALRHDTGELGWTRDGKEAPRYRSAHMAAERNLWGKEALRRWPQATHLWVVDSDVLPEPDVLEKLLDLKAPVAAAFVPIGDGVTPIAMIGWDPERDQARRTGEERLLTKPHAATLVGGSYLIRAGYFENTWTGSYVPRWGEHAQGEDGFFAEQMREIGLQMLHHPGARCAHVMERD